MNDKKEFVCDRCGSIDTVRHGVVNTVKEGKKQRRKCNECAHTFYEIDDKK
jgi:uncharacterized Zn finger protein